MMTVARTMLLPGLLAAAASGAAAQPAGMDMPAATLFVAQLDAAQVTEGSASQASGTGAFLLNPVGRTLSYSITYAGLQSGSAQSIALHNFGRGRDGPVIALLCGPGAQPCPGGNAATVRGQIERWQDKPLDNELIGEFDSGRVYVELVGSNGKPEIRGQLGQNGAMVRIANYTAQLGPASGATSDGNGTAIVSETYLPGGKVTVFYAATVANTSGPPVSVTLTGVPPAPTRPLAAAALPRASVRSAAPSAHGGTITGNYQAGAANPGMPLASRLSSAANAAPRLVVTTDRFRGGELVGTLVPVR